jgi:hypothetical protein
MLRYRVHAVALLSVALAIAACSGMHEPNSSPTQAPAGSPTQSPSATVPTSGTPSPTAAVTSIPTPAVTAGPSQIPSSTPSTAPTATPAPPATPTVAPTPGVTPVPAVTPGPIVIGPAALEGPDTIPADTLFYVNWVGPNKTGDYVSIIAANKKKWSGESYFYTYAGTPRQLLSSTKPGAYELRYIDGASKKVKARRPITVTDFVGSLSGPASVVAGTEFNVDWTGPASPGDYVTIEPVGATAWVDESFFYAYSGAHPGHLTAPLTDGPHELWYVAGDKTVMLREPITVTPVSASVSGPASVTHGATFTVSWTGPDATGDFITIVAVGAPQGSSTSYAYTQYGNPATLTAPAAAGQYEIRYVYGGGGRPTLATATIQVN